MPNAPKHHERSYRQTLCVFLAWVILFTGLLALASRWSLSDDEIYTLIDSAKPLSALLSYERKPLYYVICHFLLGLQHIVPVEVLLRLPAVLAASLTPVVFYVGLTKNDRFGTTGLFAAAIALSNPWVLQMSQFARFYSLALLFCTITVVSGYRWIQVPRKRWIWILVISGVLAGLSHTPAFLVLPGTIGGLILARLRTQPASTLLFLRRFRIPIGLLLAAVSALAVLLLKDGISFWLQSERGQFGNYSLAQLLIALAIHGGTSTWLLAMLPLVRFPASWEVEDFYLSFITVACSVPLLLLVQIGGGVAARYLMFCLPAVFLLAARHWSEIDARLPTFGFRLAAGLGFLAFNLPYVASHFQDAAHYDYQTAAEKIEQLDLTNPLIISTAHELLNHYLMSTVATMDLTDFEAGIPRDIVQLAISQSERENRPLLLVVREDRHELCDVDQDWFYSRFALLHSIHRPRFDHRRYRMAIYEYRPSPRVAEFAAEKEDRTVTPCTKLTVTP